MSGGDWQRRELLGAAVALAGTTWAGTASAQNFGDFIAVRRTVRSPAGDYHSRYFENTPPAVHAFPGIRYGRARRFERPATVASAEQLGTDNPEFGPSCPQSSAAYQPQSEDCLFLNVWMPAAASRRARPVMLYIHGGAYSNGSVTDPLNDGAALAQRGDVVVVTVNHRLNALGYLYLPGRFPDSGNAGQLDPHLCIDSHKRDGRPPSFGWSEHWHPEVHLRQPIWASSCCCNPQPVSSLESTWRS